MNIQIRYQSRSGHTKQLAEAIGNAVDIPAQSVDTPLSEPADLLFLGGAIYAGMLNGHLKRFLKKLDAGQVKRIALFSTAAGDGLIRPKVLKIIDGKGIDVLDEELHIMSSEMNTIPARAQEFAPKVIQADS